MQGMWLFDIINSMFAIWKSANFFPLDNNILQHPTSKCSAELEIPLNLEFHISVNLSAPRIKITLEDDLHLLCYAEIHFHKCYL